jgi:methanogenic corrinoid protein MtbC1
MPYPVHSDYALARNHVAQTGEGLIAMSEGEVRSGNMYDVETHRSAPSEVLRGLGDAGRRAEGVAFQTALKLAVEREVIPRLIVAKKAELDRRPVGVVVERSITAREVDQFQHAVVRENLDDCAGLVEKLRDAGVSRHSVYLGLFAPVARHLGALWESDDLNFVDVSIGIGRLQSLLNRMSDDANAAAMLDAEHRIVLAAAPGDQHGLGLSVVTEFFRMAGWHVAGGASLDTGRELESMVGDTWFGVVGLSASTEDKAQLLKADIAALRRASRNQRIAVLVGGHGFDVHPELSRDIGADGLAVDGAQAVEEAERLLHR